MSKEDTSLQNIDLTPITRKGDRQMTKDRFQQERDELADSIISKRKESY